MPQLTMLPTATLKPDPNQPRKSRDPEKQRQLNESIALHGILQPVGVRANKITLAWGEGRLIGAVAAGLPEVPAVVLDKSMAEWQYQNLQLVENVVRSDIGHFDLWQSCLRLMEANPGWGLKDLAKALSYDASALTRIMSPSRCIPAVVDALRDGKIVFGHTYAISKAEAPEEQARLLSLALAGISRDKLETERAGQKSRSGIASAVKASRVKIAMPEATLVITGKELSMSEVVNLLSETLKQARKAADRYDVKTWVRMMKDVNRDQAECAGD